MAVGAPRLLNPKAAFAAINGDFPIGPRWSIRTRSTRGSESDRDGTVTMKIGKVELGQGTVTAAMQLVADELDVPLSKVKFVQADTWVTPDQGYDGGEPVDRHPDRQCRHPSGRCRGPAALLEHGVGEARRAGREPERLGRRRQRGRSAVGLLRGA